MIRTGLVACAVGVLAVAGVLWARPDRAGPAPLALAEASTAPGDRVLASGTTVLSAPIVLGSGTTLRGRGVHATTLRAGRAMEAMIVSADEDGGQSGVTLADLTLDCAGVAKTGVRLVRVSDLALRRVRVVGCGGDGIVLSGHGRPTRGFRLEGVEATGNRGRGVVVQWAMRDGVYDGVVARGNGGVGITIDHSEATANGLVARANGGHGVYLRNLFATTIDAVTATHNGGHGVLVEGWVHSVGTSWRAQSNGRADPDASADVLFSARDDLSYGATRRSALSGVVVGAYHEMGHEPAARRGLVVEPGVGDLTVANVARAEPADALPPR